MEIKPGNMVIYPLLIIIKHICVIPCFKSIMAATITAKIAPKRAKMAPKCSENHNMSHKYQLILQ